MDGNFSKRFVFDLQRFEGEGGGDETPAAAEPEIAEVSNASDLKSKLEAGGIVKLLADIKLTETLTISKTVTLDLNGHNITSTLSSTEGRAIKVSSTFTLRDTSADANGKIIANTDSQTGTDNNKSTNNNVIYVDNSGKFIMENGTVEITNSTKASRTINATSNTEPTEPQVEIKGGTIIGNYIGLSVGPKSKAVVTGANTTIYVKSKVTQFNSTDIGNFDDGDVFGITIWGSSEVTVGTEGDTSGPTITAVAADNNTQGEAAAVAGNGGTGEDAKKSNITILSGTLSATGGAHNNLGIYNPSVDSELTIKGGTIKGGDEKTYGGTGVEVRAAKKVNVTGGEIIGAGGSASFSAVPNSNGSTTKGAGLAIAQHNTKEKIEVNISGDAKVSGAVALAVTNPQNSTDTTQNIELNVTGGEFEGTEAAVFYQDNRSELDVTDGNFKGAVITTYKTENRKFVIAQADEEGVQDAFTVSSGSESTTNANVKIAGGSYDNASVVKYTSNVTDGDNEAVWDETTKTYSVVNKGAGWTARDTDNKIFDYIISSGGEQTLLAVSLTSALSTTDSLDYLKADSTNRVLGVQENTSNAITGSSLNSVLNEDLTGKFSWLKFKTGNASDITITPQAAGVKIIGTDIIGKATKLVTETLSAEAAASISAVTVSAADNSLNAIFGSVGDDSIVAADKRNTTIDGGAGADIIRGGTGADSLKGGAGNDHFYYSAGKDTIADFDDQDQVILDSDSGLTPITDGSKITSTTNSFTLDFGKGNTLTFEKVNDALPTVSIASSQHYVYTKDWVMEEDKSVTLAAGVTTYAIDNKIMTVDGSAATGNLTITDNANNNYIVMGGNKTTFNYKGGNDVIAGYTYGNDVVNLNNTLTPPTSFDNVSITSSDYAISLGTSNSLTFKSASEIELTKDSDTYTYKRDRIAWEGHGITLGSEYSNKTFNGNSNANSDYATINAASVTGSLRITGNSNENLIYGGQGGGTIYGGDENDTLVAGSIGTYLNGQDGADSLVGGSGKDTFAYTGGADSIYSYEAQDLVSVASGINVAAVSVSTANTNDLVLDFDGEKLTFEGGKGKTISLKSGRHNYLFAAESITSGKGVTLTAGFNRTDSIFSYDDAYDTIDAALVAQGISITGNDNGNYIVGSATKASSLVGGTGDDTFRGGTGNDVFFYGGGKDVIFDFGAADSLSIDAPETNIAKARASSRRLTFTMTDKSNTLVFRSDDSIPAQISLDGGGYLTKDGVVKGGKLDLFSSAKGRIDLREDTVYSAAGITSISAENVKSQSVTLVGGTDGGSFTFAGTNKKRDGFEYNGGAVSISGYESGKDRINLGDYSITGFTADNSKVAISLGGGTGNDNAISLLSAKGDEILIHQSTNRGNSYSKMVFAQNGVVYDKAASKATNATIWAGGNGYSAEGTKVRKITVKDSLVSGISLGAGNNNTVIDASAAGAVSLISGAKNDRFIGSSNADMFVYSAGKDIIQDFNIGGETDQISLNGSGLELDDAKISAGKKSIRFKFAGSSKNVLTVKPTKGDTLSGELTINGKDRTYSKNAIIEDKTASLTSAFGGTYKIDGVSTVDGHLVEKKLTVKGTTADETIVGGKNKTTFKGGGGTDSLVGGSGDDIFFYARGDKGTATIADFDFSNDKLKIAGGTLAKVSTIQGGGVRFGMKNGKGESPEVGWFDVKTSATYDDDDKSTLPVDGSKVLIKTNNTYYWFAKDTITEPVTAEGGNGEPVTLAKAGDLITWDKKVSSSDVKNHDSAVIELNYGTNLVRAGVAVAVSKDNDKATLPSA